MALSWNDIKDRALAFSREWSGESSEKAEAKSFWDAFFHIFCIPRRRIATFEKRVKKIDGKDGYIDLLWKGILLIESKSLGGNLDRAFSQAKDYFPGLKDHELPRYILVSDFARFRLYDLEEEPPHEFTIEKLYEHIKLFGFIAGYQPTSYKEQDPVNVQAAEHMGKLHDKLQATGYQGHHLEIYLVRLLFCLFAEDTSIFERCQFQDLIEQRTAEDGRDLAQWLENLFQVLNTPDGKNGLGNKRLQNLDEHLSAFPYVNGSLFSERLPIAAFDTEMRNLLLDCCVLNWSRISPAIFGALFQSAMDQKLRRNLGAHYTTEQNILKLIKPLFLDELRKEFERVKSKPKKLGEFHKKLSQLKFLDPACGCGNFLVIAYRELRLLELDILRILVKDGSLSLDVVEFNILCNVDQFFGIEIEEFPAQIAQTALWLTDHQMNMRVSEEFGKYYARLPLEKSATIIHGNALQVDWRKIVAPESLSYILGNPPFGGKQYQSQEQKKDLWRVFNDVQGARVLDFVAAWYRIAIDYMAENPKIRAAYVSTNSITQGEQVGVLWGDLLKRGVKIHFAHRTFQWSSEARGKAAVHCVIIGFALQDTTEKRIFDYETPQSTPKGLKVQNINPYLVDAPDVLLKKRRKPIQSTPEIALGSIPYDGGNLILTPEEKLELIKANPKVSPYIRPLMGSKEFINNHERYCIWLPGIPPVIIRKFPCILDRLERVREMRLASQRLTTQKLASCPMVFGELRQPNTDYLAIPEVSSERRSYIPIGFISNDVIASNLLYTISRPTIYHLGILTSSMHMAWMRAVCGRLENRYRYSASIVYNNFPWPQNPTDKQQQAVEKAAQAVLDARAKYPTSSLADLYDPLSMPSELAKAHHKLDTTVDNVYAKKKFSGDSDRVAFLFQLYEQIATPILPKKSKHSKRTI